MCFLMQSLRFARPVLHRCQVHFHFPSISRPSRGFREPVRPVPCCTRRVGLILRPCQLSRHPTHSSHTCCSAEPNNRSSSHQPSQTPQWPSRDALCGQQDLQHEGRRLALCGWVHRARNMGGIVFADLRDHSGILQVCTWWMGNDHVCLNGFNLRQTRNPQCALGKGMRSQSTADLKLTVLEGNLLAAVVISARFICKQSDHVLSQTRPATSGHLRGLACNSVSEMPPMPCSHILNRSFDEPA